MSHETTLSARWIFCSTAQPLERGVLTFADGKIVAVEPQGARRADVDLGNVGLVPGFVNTHTHLDLSGARGLTPSSDYVAWLRQVIEHRKRMSWADRFDDVATGWNDCTKLGTTLIGDISADGWSWRAATTEGNCRATIFLEALGLTHERSLQAWESVAEWDNWTDSRRKESHEIDSRLRAGVSPHAPYSVHRDLFEKVFHESRRTRNAVAVHLAEWPSESRLLKDHTGILAEFLKELGVWAPNGLANTWADIINWAQGPFPALLVHCNYLPVQSDVPSNATIVYCPRTHAAFGHPLHPFREFMSRGVRIAFGTDSLASNPDLSVLAEARFIRARHPDLPGAAILRMATLHGAEALGWADVTGSLEPGKSADFAVVQLPDRDCGDPHDLLFDSELPVIQTWFRGVSVYRAAEPQQTEESELS